MKTIIDELEYRFKRGEHKQAQALQHKLAVLRGAK